MLKFPLPNYHQELLQIVASLKDEITYAQPEDEDNTEVNRYFEQYLNESIFES